MHQELVELLTRTANSTRAAKINVGSGLAGNINSQFKAVLTPKDQAVFMDHINNIHLRNYYKEEWQKKQHHLVNKSDIIPNFEKLVFELDSAPWINFQQANEFNPIHSHIGIISAVLYIDVPTEIAQEVLTPMNTNMRCPGQIEFMYGSDMLNVNGTHKIIPKTGDILLFPAGLKHTVYPFTSDVERLSMSFNVSSVGYAEAAGFGNLLSKTS